MKTRFIIIWGMHRSGTSLLARSLRVFGADLGNNLFPADRGNQKGYFEDRDLINLDGAMLRELGMDWDSLGAIAPGHVKLLSQKGYLDKALEFLRFKSMTGQLVGLKEPRMTRLAPFWRKAFKIANIEPISVICWRHPLAVAASLRKRALTWKKFSLVENIDYSLLLWLGYTLSALICTTGLPSVIVEYENFMSQPVSMLENMAARLNLDIDKNELDIFDNSFVDRTMNHYADVSAPSCHMPARVKELYQLLASLPALERPDPAQIGSMWPDSDTEIAMCGLLDKASRKIRGN